MDQTCDETISNLSNYIYRGHRGRDRMQLVTITTDVVSLNLDQGEVYNIM